MTFAEDKVDIDYRIAEINGKERFLLFDTGASQNLISEESIRKLGIKEYQKYDKIKTYKLPNETDFTVDSYVELDVRYKSF